MPREAQMHLSQFLQVYDERQLHEALAYRTPAEVYFQEEPRRDSVARSVQAI